MTSSEKIKMTAVLSLFFAVLTLGGCSSAAQPPRTQHFMYMKSSLTRMTAASGYM